MLADIVECADVRMIEGADRLGFAFEPLATIGVGGGFVGQNLDRDGAIEPAVGRSIDFAHAARAKRRNDFIGTETRAGRRGSCELAFSDSHPRNRTVESVAIPPNK